MFSVFLGNFGQGLVKWPVEGRCWLAQSITRYTPCFAFDT
jgi:hypothetical protein